MPLRIIKMTVALVALAVCFCGQNKGDGGGLRKNDGDTNKLTAQTQVLDSVDSLPSPIEPKDGISANENDLLSINEYAPFSFVGYDEPDEDVLTNSIDSGRIITPVGYDGKTPIFNSSICDKRCQPDSVIYEYVDRRLKKMDMVAPSGTELVIVKNGVYVFREDIDSQTTRYHLKAREKETITDLNISLVSHWKGGEVMNDKYIFIYEGPATKGRRILRVNYRTQAKTDTIRLAEYCSDLLDADNNYLYFVDYNPHEAGRDGHLYRMDLKTKVSEVIVRNTENVTESMALVAPLNLLYTHGEIVDYKNELFAISPDKTLRHSPVGVFYSYEDKAFIISDWKTDINKWRILRLQDIIKWIPNTAEAYEKKTGPWAVPFIKRCENNRCTTGVARAYREQTGCTDLSGLSGNQMFDYLVKSSKGPQPAFKKIGIDETYTLADSGRIVIAAHKNTKEHGHVTLIVPGRSKNKEYWQIDAKMPICYSCEQIYLPYVKDTGPKKPVEKQLISESYEPRRQNDVKFFVYTGTGCKEQ